MTAGGPILLNPISHGLIALIGARNSRQFWGQTLRLRAPRCPPKPEWI